MDKKEFEKLVMPKIEEVQKIIDDNMPDKGLKCEDSQKMCLIDALRKFEHCVNGTEDKDFEIHTYLKAIRNPDFDDLGSDRPYAVVLDLYDEFGCNIESGSDWSYFATEQEAEDYIKEYNEKGDG